MSDLFVSYAQHGEDVVLWRAMGQGPPRFYIDVGAFDPTEDSVTRALYERGWRGVNIEPQPTRISNFVRDRPEDINLAVALGAQDGTGSLIVPAISGWATTSAAVAAGLRESGSVQEMPVPMRSLNSILAEFAITQIDVLKIDVEGAEPDVLAGLDLSAVRPRVFVIEGVAPVIGRAGGDRAVALLLDAGYRHCMFDGLNHYLTCDPTLAEALSTPANPLDEYQPAALTALEGAIAAYEAERREFHSAIASLEAAGGQGSATQPIRVPSKVVAYESAHPDRVLALRRDRFRHAISTPRPALRSGTRSSESLDSSRAPTVYDALRSSSHSDRVVAMYMAVLGRAPDDEGKAHWAALLETGLSPLELAEALASSPEGSERPAEARHRTAGQLRSFRARAALHELGSLSDDAAPIAYTAGTVTGEILIRAVYAVCLGRAPSEAEVMAEVMRLSSGMGREALIREFARRPETLARVYGAPNRSARSRARFAVGRIQIVGLVRMLVLAAEQRQVAMLLEAASPNGPDQDRGTV